MVRDFEQIIGDARFWLRMRGTVKKPSLSNELANFGWISRAQVVLADTDQKVMTIEHKNFLGSSRRIGALLVTANQDLGLERGILKWGGPEGLAVISPLTRVPGEVVPISGIPGVTRDRLYDLFAPVMQEIVHAVSHTGE